MKETTSLSRKERRRIRRSNYKEFTDLFNFFLKAYRCKLIDFAGSFPIKTKQNLTAHDAKFCFTAYNNGEYSVDDNIETKHPNILTAVIMGKKGWGLWQQQWAIGVAEKSFTEDEIFSQFVENKIIIPESLIQDFRNTCKKKETELLNNSRFYINLHENIKKINP